MDIEAANKPASPAKSAWICPCQGCKKARIDERDLVITWLYAGGYEDAAFFIQNVKK